MSTTAPSIEVDCLVNLLDFDLAVHGTQEQAAQTLCRLLAGYADREGRRIVFAVNVRSYDRFRAEFGDSRTIILPVIPSQPFSPLLASLRPKLLISPPSNIAPFDEAHYPGVPHITPILANSDDLAEWRRILDEAGLTSRDHPPADAQVVSWPDSVISNELAFWSARYGEQQIASSETTSQSLDTPRSVGDLTRQLQEKEAVISEMRAELQRLRQLEIGNKYLARVAAHMATSVPVIRKVVRSYVNLRTPKLGILKQYAPIPLNIPSYDSSSGSGQDNLPPIAVVTPSYNQGAFLARTIDSVLKQGYPALEYVIQDGGSTDNTQQVLDAYRSRLTYVESAKDKGQADAINLGFAHTTADIMAYLNADDLLLPGALRVVGNYFKTHPEVDCVYGHRIVIDNEDREIGRWVLPPHDNAVLLWADYIPQETLFWRRQAWEKAGGHVDADFQFAIDWELILRFREADIRFVRLPRFLGAFRVH